MSQQINLYAPSFRKPKKHFTARTMLEATVLVIVGLATLYVYARFQVNALAREARVFDERVRVGLERVKQLPGAPAAPDDKPLDARIAQLDSQLRSAEQLLGQPGMSRSDTSYAEPLKALARHRVEGVWLTSITLAGDGGELSLAGRALRAELVPQYIARLSNDPAMRGRRFATLAIERDAPAKKDGAPKGEVAAKAPESVAFRLSATPEEK